MYGLQDSYSRIDSKSGYIYTSPPLAHPYTRQKKVRRGTELAV